MPCNSTATSVTVNMKISKKGLQVASHRLSCSSCRRIPPGASHTLFGARVAGCLPWGTHHQDHTSGATLCHAIMACGANQPKTQSPNNVILLSMLWCHNPSSRWMNVHPVVHSEAEMISLNIVGKKDHLRMSILIQVSESLDYDAKKAKKVIEKIQILMLHQIKLLMKTNC